MKFYEQCGSTLRVEIHDAERRATLLKGHFMLDRRSFLSLTSLALLGGLPVVAQEPKVVGDAPKRSKDRAGIELITAPTKTALQRALAFLAKRQNSQGQHRGAFGTQGYAGGVAVCGLGGLAFLASGSAPGRGLYGKHIERCVEYLSANTDAKGFISAVALGSMDNMYGHGFATLFLAEAYGMSMHADVDEKLGKKVRAAVNLIVATQSDAGGWRYQPQKSDADLSITICQIMALRAARDAGVDVPTATRDKCIDYVKKSQAPNGSFCYTLGNGHGSFALTAAGVVALNSAGIYDSPEVEKGLKFISASKPNGTMNDGYFFYSQYYAAQAMWHAGGDYWSGWYTAIRDTLLKTQKANGAWQDPGVGEEFGTAMACIILQLPYNYVPVFGES